MELKFKTHILDVEHTGIIDTRKNVIKYRYFIKLKFTNYNLIYKSDLKKWLFNESTKIERFERITISSNFVYAKELGEYLINKNIPVQLKEV